MANWFSTLGRETPACYSRHPHEMSKPLAIDLFCGLGGWTEGLLAEGYKVIGFDIERHDYGDGKRYPAQLVIQDVLTIHGSQFKDAALIVASPPCQKFSYMAMPWSRAKAIAAEYRSGKRDVKNLTALFDACFRIQREAIEAAGHFIPLVVENVRGAQPWVGRARWNFGSYYLWGDVPALMPITMPRVVMKQGIAHRQNGETNFYGYKSPANSCKRNPGARGGKISGYPHLDTGYDACPKEGRKGVGSGPKWFDQGTSRFGSKSKARKAASALIAKIPLPLARWIARVYKPVVKKTC